MKALFMLALLGLAASAQAQKTDTVSVPIDGTSYLIFDEPITLFNIGTKAYVGKVEDRMLFLKALSDHAETTTLLVQAGSQIFTGYVRFANKPKKNFYDYRRFSDAPVATASLKMEGSPATVAPVHSFTKMKNARTNVTVKESTDGILIECVQIFNDQKNTYLRFNVKNTTTIAYTLDLVSFTYKEKLPRRLRNKVAPQYEEMTPIDRIEPARIDAGRSENFYYAIPLYSTTDKGFLEVIFRERVGARVVTVKIPSTKIMDASLL